MTTTLKLSSIIVIFLSVTYGYAQSAESGGKSFETRAQSSTEWMKRKLNLSLDQVPKVHDINLKYAKQIDSIRVTHVEQRGRFKDAKVIADAKNKELKEIFTEDQFVLYQEKKAERRKQGMKQYQAKE